MDKSEEAEASNFPFGSYYTQFTWLVWPVSVCSNRPVSKSHNFTVPSSLADAI